MRSQIPFRRAQPQRQRAREGQRERERKRGKREEARVFVAMVKHS